MSARVFRDEAMCSGRQIYIFIAEPFYMRYVLLARQSAKLNMHADCVGKHLDDISSEIDGFANNLAHILNNHTAQH
jgi:hypothetical protein